MTNLEYTVSDPSSEAVPTVSGLVVFKDLAPVHKAVEDKSRVPRALHSPRKLTFPDQPSVSVLTVTIPGHVETSYITESARVTVVTLSASTGDDDSPPVTTSSGSGAPWSLPLFTETLTGGSLLLTASGGTVPWSLPLFTETLSEGSLLLTPTDESSSMVVSVTVGASSLPTSTGDSPSTEAAGVTLGANSSPTPTGDDPPTQTASITAGMSSSPDLSLASALSITTVADPPTGESSSTSATAASQAPTVPTEALPPNDPTIAPVFTAAPVVNPIYSLFTSLPNPSQPHKRYNASSSIIPVWSPQLLGNAYGGGLVRPPTVFALVAPQATGTLRGIAPAYGYTVFPLSEPSPTATLGGGLDTSGDANYTYSVGGSSSTGLYSKDSLSGTAAGPSASASLGFGGYYPGNGTYRAQVEGPLTLFEVSYASRETVGLFAVIFSVWAILFPKALEVGRALGEALG